MSMSSSIDARSSSRSRRLLNLSREFPSFSSSSPSPSPSQIPHQRDRDSVPVLSQSASPAQSSTSPRTRSTQDPLPSSVSTSPSPSPSASASASASGSGSQSVSVSVPVPVSTSSSLSGSGSAPATSASILSRSSSQRAARLSSFFPALAKAGLVLSSSSSAFSSSPAAAAASSPASAHSSSSSAREMRSSRPREQSSKTKALLALKLSGSSFLDTVIRDDKTKDPIYILETVRELTHVYRLDYHRDEPVKAATIQWPIHPVRVKGKTGRSIQFGNGSWREAEELLKTGPLGSNAIRKFNIPHYPNSLKWKLIPGNCFCCVTNAVKGPVAVLDAATLSAPPRLKVYHPLIDRDLARSQDNYKGIPTIFLDYLVVTSLLLVTDVQEWLDRPREAHIPGSSSYTVQRWLALIHHTPAPPEPDHPTVDLSLTVPSTPPHSATFPNSPGGFWETQSGVTSLSGSGSGASYAGEPFTPTTPATPATSASSSAFFSRSLEEVPPVPPVPGAGLGSATSGAGSSLAHYAEQQGRARERPKSNPQASLAQSPLSSSSSTAAAAGSHPYAQPGDAAGGEDDDSKQPRARLGHVSAPGGGQGLGALSASAPTSPLPNPGSSSNPTSSRPTRRQLPVPPGPVPANSFAQPWLYSSPASSAASSSTPVPSPSTLPPAPPTSSPSSASPSTTANANSAARAARASMRGSLRTAPIPPPPPPPQHSIPLPPKLAQEQQRGGYGARPRTAPELDGGAESRRRHSESFAAALGQYGAGSEASTSSTSPDSDDVPAGAHPYAYASTGAGSSTFDLRGREREAGERDRDREMHDLVTRMQGMSASPGSYQHPHAHHAHHARAPSMPAPDYDTHSFVNVPPPLPVPPSSSSGTGSRPPPRRQLTVVNADMPAHADDDSPRSSSFSPHSSVGSPQAHHAQGMTYAMNIAYNTLNNNNGGGGGGAVEQGQGQGAAGQQGTASPGDLRLDPRMSYAESVYEMPPPAYDAIDFSVQFVPPVPPLPAHLAVVNVAPQGPPVDAGADGQRGP
ncbi:hypothetical protein PYCCODRAFT_1456561 [Trametes coccinea BRFM310]|uniref:Uncharacterized protein n=1 Tax=Trametes coccinea (strain BRFM310) TaxID=1353009 RepID=A0A1Y2J0P9_TRAC3|nr:hypothetical protein PYCCODRAFT_1456561 [Trametes coccinea BRFM310]